MKKLIFGFALALGLTSAIAQDWGSFDYEARGIGGLAGGTSKVSAATTNEYVLTLDKHDDFIFYFSRTILSATNCIGASNTVTLRFYNKASRYTTNDPTAVFTKALSMDTNHVTTWATNPIVGSY